MGLEWAFRLFPDAAMGNARRYCRRRWVHNQLLDESVLKCLGTPKHIEDVIKRYARDFNLPRGGWKKVYDNVVGQYIQKSPVVLHLKGH
jgi:hypothetical protein